MFRPLQRLFVGHVHHAFPGDPETSTMEQSTSGAEPTAVAPVTHTFPQEIIDEILDHLAADPGAGCQSELSLRHCSLVCKSWVESCQRHLFCELYFNVERMRKWLQVFPVPEQSPGHHVRSICINFGGSGPVLRKIIKRIQGFTNLKTITVYMDRGGRALWTSHFVGLPQSVTSLRLMENSISLRQIREVITQLPNLDDLYLSGALSVTDKNQIRGIGTTLTAKFRGRLQLCTVSPGCSHTDIVNMLLEVPTGLHFTDVHSWACVSSTVRIVEACSKTLMKLVYVIYSEGESAPLICKMLVLISYSILVGHEGLDRTFDFMKSPNLEELKFEIRLTARDLHWISEAISTLKPTTSPRLSTLRLTTSYRLPEDLMPDHLKEHLGNVTQLVEEVARVEREFMGAVKVTVPWRPEVPVLVSPISILLAQVSKVEFLY